MKKIETIPLNEHEKDFYAYIGLLSCKFAQMEYNLMQLLVKLINNEEDFVTLTIIENNNLHQNIELFKKINRFRDFQAQYITGMLDKISKVKTNRNRFIHGVWAKPRVYQNDVISSCIDFKIRFSSRTDKAGKIQKEWHGGSHEDINVSYIVQQIHQLNDILYIQETMLKKIEENGVSD